MAEFDEKTGHWYTRRDGVVRGPFPRGQISRYILLGRIRETDEIRFEFGDWKTVEQCPDLIPEVMKLPPTEENLQKLLLARMHEDERRPGSRRDDSASADNPPVERRYREDRRQNEPELFQRHRILKKEIADGWSEPRPDYRSAVLITLIVVLGFTVSYWLDRPSATSNEPDCRAQPRPGVNWDNCRFTGVHASGTDLRGASIRNARLDGGLLANSRLANARLDYSSLAGVALGGADLSNAVLVGSDLSNADLTRANLMGADLSYANLGNAVLDGARFDGARLDHAIWVDHHECAPDSVGRCLPTQEPQHLSGP